MLTQSKTLSIKIHLVRHFKCSPSHKQVNMNAENILHLVETVATHKHEFCVLMLLLPVMVAFQDRKILFEDNFNEIVSEMLCCWC